MAAKVVTFQGQVATPQGFEEALGSPSWAWRTHNELTPPCCGLSPHDIQTAGWGDDHACCRIWIHADGWCIGPGMDVEEDRHYVKQVLKLLGKEGVADGTV